MEYTDLTFTGNNFSETGFEYAEYDGCSFENCNFSETDLKGSIFIACSFINCNLSLARINKVSMQQVNFTGSKLLGIHFEDASPFGLQISFENCNLESASFFGLKLSGTRFVQCKMSNTDFTNADIQGSDLSGSDLSDARFDNTNLEKADFRSAIGFQIDPDKNRLKKAKFNAQNALLLLEKYRLDITN